MKHENRCFVCDDSKMGVMPKMSLVEKMKWEKDCLSEARILKECFLHGEKKESDFEDL